jgi:hypothetical protein
MSSAAPNPARPLPSNIRLIGSGTEVPGLTDAKASIGTSKPVATNKRKFVCSLKNLMDVLPSKGSSVLAAFSIPHVETVEKMAD